MSTCILRTFIETDASNRPSYVGTEFDAYFDGI